VSRRDGCEQRMRFYLYILEGALQLRMNRCGYTRFAQVPEQVSTKNFVVLIIENSKSNHLGAQGTFKKVPCAPK